MPELSDAQDFCQLHSIPINAGWVIFMSPDGLVGAHIAFAWAISLPHCFQPFRCVAINLETGEQVKAVGLGGRQRWGAV